MWRPFADTNFRYHVLYTNANKKFDSALATNSKVQDNKITVGMKIDI
jgi:hypothetical protein